MSETDYTGITKRQQETWATGDFTQIARQNWVMAETLVEAVDPHQRSGVGRGLWQWERSARRSTPVL